jgi:hypothetical protein
MDQGTINEHRQFCFAVKVMLQIAHGRHGFMRRRRNKGGLIEVQPGGTDPVLRLLEFTGGPFTPLTFSRSMAWDLLDEAQAHRRV